MRARTCSECLLESPETHLVRGEPLCGRCLRVRARALGWEHPSVGPASGNPFLEPPFELQEFETVYRSRVAVRGPFSWNQLDQFRQGLSELVSPPRLALMAGKPRHWGVGKVESACGLLRFRLPSAHWGVRYDFEELCRRWPEFVNYRDLLPVGALRNYLEGIEQLLLGRLPEAMELAHRYGDSNHRNLEAILLVHFGIWDEASRIWGKFTGHREHDENLELLKRARGCRVEKVDELHRLAQAIESYRRQHKQCPINLAGFRGHRWEGFEYECWANQFKLRVKGCRLSALDLRPRGGSFRGRRGPLCG